MAPQRRTLRRLLGERIRELRKTLTDLSQERFANFVGLERAHYGRIECGLVNVRLDTLETIAAGLGVTVPELFDFQD